MTLEITSLHESLNTNASLLLFLAVIFLTSLLCLLVQFVIVVLSGIHNFLDLGRL